MLYLDPSSINAAAYLEKPEPPKGESNFVGLINQYTLN